MKNIIYTLIFIVSFSLFSCGQSGEIQIGILMPETHVERWKRDGQSLLDDATEMGYKVEVAYGDADQSKQNKQIEDFITRGAKLLIVGSVNEGAAEAVEKAKGEGVIVVAYDRLITGTDAYDYYITFDNYKVGQMQGSTILEGLASRGDSSKKITLFAGSPTDNNAKYFFDGAMSELNGAIESGDLMVIGPNPTSSEDANFSQITTENWRPDIAKARMENLLNGDAKDVVLDAVLSPNDTLARAIIEALSADAKYTSTLPIVSGQDGELASVKMIKDGKQYMTVFKDTRSLAKATIELADSLLKNETPSISGTREDTESYNTGKKNVTSFLLSPIKVTKDNYESVFVDGGYYSADDLK